MADTIDITSFLEQTHEGLPLLDARSPKEYQDGHIHGAFSLPLLNDDERHQVGTTYKQQGRDAAVRLGYQLVGHKFVEYIDTARSIAKDGKVCLYCWRGGIRSNTMAWLLRSAGLEVYVLDGGYKQFRQWCLEHFAHQWPLMVVSGKTGAGKTELLHELRNRGESIIDLEGLANHRGSAFGGIGLPLQPTQEAFENALAWELNKHSKASRIWIENESRFIGRVRIPDVFFDHFGASSLVMIDRDVHSRALRILDEYGKFDTAILAEKTIGITKRMGGDRVKESIDALNAGDMVGWVMPLLDYYDRNYEHSIHERKGSSIGKIEATSEGVEEIAKELLLLQPKVND